MTDRDGTTHAYEYDDDVSAPHFDHKRNICQHCTTTRVCFRNARLGLDPAKHYAQVNTKKFISYEANGQKFAFYHRQIDYLRNGIVAGNIDEQSMKATRGCTRYEVFGYIAFYEVGQAARFNNTGEGLGSVIVGGKTVAADRRADGQLPVGVASATSIGALVGGYMYVCV